MYSSKLLRIIRAIDKQKIELLKNYVHSKSFNSDKLSEDVATLFDYLIDQMPDFCEDLLKKEMVHSVIYPDRAYKKSRIDLLMNKLLKIVKVFIKHQYTIVKEEEIAELLALAKFSKENSLTQQFNLTIKALWKKQQGIEIKDSDFYYNDFLINQEIVLFNSIYNQRKDDLNILETIKSLDLYYVITKLEYACALLSVSKEIAVDLEDSIVLLKALSPLIEKGSLGVPLVKVYYQAFLLLLEGEEAVYFKFKNILEEHQNSIPLTQIKSLYAHARNYCIEQYNKGKSEYLQEAFELYQKHLDQGLLYYHSDGLLPSTFQTIIRIGLKLKAFDWVKAFLTQFKDRIAATQYPEEVYNFNLANYYFCIQAYDKVLECLSGNYENIYYTLYARRLEIKTYFETKSVLLDSKINNFKIFVFRNNKLSKEGKSASNNFIDMLKQIMNYKTMNNEKRIERIKDKINAKKRIAEKEWLLEQLEKMR